jgi:Ca2+/Na+ antiporter
MLVLPLIPLAMALTGIAGVAGLVLPLTFARIVGFPAELLLRYMTSVVNYLAQLPLALAEVSFSATSAIVSYVLLCVCMLHLWRKTGYEFREYNVIE